MIAVNVQSLPYRHEDGAAQPLPRRERRHRGYESTSNDFRPCRDDDVGAAIPPPMCAEKLTENKATEEGLKIFSDAFNDRTSLRWTGGKRYGGHDG